MVLYYSATGNTEYISKEIARRLDDECVDLLDRIKNQDFTEFHSEKPFIICAPVYVCEMPRFMSKYLKNRLLPVTEMYTLSLQVVVIVEFPDSLPNGCSVRKR